MCMRLFPLGTSKFALNIEVKELCQRRLQCQVHYKLFGYFGQVIVIMGCFGKNSCVILWEGKEEWMNVEWRRKKSHDVLYKFWTWDSLHSKHRSHQCKPWSLGDRIPHPYDMRVYTVAVSCLVLCALYGIFRVILVILLLTVTVV